MKRLIKKGSVDQTLDIFIQDSSSTVGAGLAGLVFNTASLVCYYRRGATGSATALTLATQTVGGAHSDGGFVEISSTNMPGMYRLDLSDAIIATGVPYVVIMLKGATNMAPVLIEIQLVDFDPENATTLGLSALPNAAAEAAGGLFTRGTGAGQINQAANGMIDTNPVRLNNVSQSLLDLKDFADDGYDPSTNKVQGVVLTDTVTTYTGNTPQTGDAFARLGAPAGASVSADVAAVKTDTGNLITRIPAALFSGITSLAQWLGLLGGKQTGNTTARTELNATGAGSGTYDETVDSLEAHRDLSVTNASSLSDLSSRLPAALDGGRMNSSVNSIASAQLTAIAAAVWDRLTSALSTVGSIGKLLIDNINATISSRSTLTAADVNAEADTALADVGVTTTVTGRIDAAISTRATPSQVNAEVLDVMVTDTFAEPSSVPAATSSLKDKLNWVFALMRNKRTQTATTETLRNDADSGNIATSAKSDDGTTYTRGEWS